MVALGQDEAEVGVRQGRIEDDILVAVGLGLLSKFFDRAQEGGERCRRIEVDEHTKRNANGRAEGHRTDEPHSRRPPLVTHVDGVAREIEPQGWTWIGERGVQGAKRIEDGSAQKEAVAEDRARQRERLAGLILP